MSDNMIRTDNKPTSNKPLREISVEGCKVLGAGGNGAIYRLDDETIVKVYFSERHSPERINKNRETTKKAFVHGIPTMIAFDMVRVGIGLYGMYPSEEVKNVKMCPQCGCPLKLRNGEYGEFWGCTGYPACRYTARHASRPSPPCRARSGHRPSPHNWYGRRTAWGR